MIGTYTGWCHAGWVILIFLVSGGGKYFSLNCVRGVVAKYRFDGSPGRWTRQQLAQGLKQAEPDPSTKACKAFDSCAAAPLLTRVVAVGLACAYMGDVGTDMNMGDGDLRKLYAGEYLKVVQ